MATEKKLAGIDKAAILFDILGARLAGQLFPNLSDQEIIAVRQRVPQIKSVHFEYKKLVLEEFYFSFMSPEFYRIKPKLKKIDHLMLVASVH